MIIAIQMLVSIVLNTLGRRFKWPKTVAIQTESLACALGNESADMICDEKQAISEAVSTVLKDENPTLIIREEENSTAAPVMRARRPNIENSGPEVTNSGPEVKNSDPEVKNSDPEVKNSDPEVKNAGPEVTNPAPEITNSGPQVTNSAPEITNSNPEMTDSGPEITSSGQGFTKSVPEIANPSREITKSSPKPTNSGPKPIRMWIDGKCYNLIAKYRKKRRYSGFTSADEEEKYEANNTEDESFNVSQTNFGKYSSTFFLPSWYCMKLHSDRDFSIKHLAQSTNTQIKIPYRNKEGACSIMGDDVQSVTDARHELQAAFMQLRERATALQFISIPTVNEGIKGKFLQLKNEILEGGPTPGIDPSIFISENKLHLTVCVFSLMNDAEKSEAISALMEYKTEVFEPFLKKTGPLKIKVAGLECMNNNYSKVHVLYAKAKLTEEKEEADLQSIVNDICHYFYERGLLRRYENNVRLHVTLMNSKYRSKESNSTPKRHKWQDSRMSFDATQIMEKYKDFEFGEIELDQVTLSLMGQVGEDGFYKNLAVIKV